MFCAFCHDGFPGAEAEGRDGVGRRIIRSAAGVQRGAGDLHAGAGDQTFIDGVAQFDSRVSVGRVHVLNGGEAAVEIHQGVVESDERCVRIVGIGALDQVHVAVDQAGQHGGAAEIDHGDAGGDLDFIGGADVDDAVAFNQDDLVREIGAGLGIEHASGAHRDALRRRGLHVHAVGVPGGGFGAFGLGEKGERAQAECDSE